MIQSRKEINKGLEEIFQETFEDEEIVLTDDTTAEDIEEWDSIGHMTLISALEEKFGITFETDDIVDFSSYKKGLEILKKYKT